MAMLVLLSFEDDEEALRFVDNALEDRVYEANTMTTDMACTRTKVRALYKKPTQFHGSFETHGARKTEAGWTRGQKWGWQICSVCGKPSQMAWDSILTAQSSFGYNILGRYFEGLVPEQKCLACGDTYPKPAEHHHTRAQCKAKLTEKKEAANAEEGSVPDRASEVLPAGLSGDVQAPPMGQDQS